MQPSIIDESHKPL